MVYVCMKVTGHVTVGVDCPSDKLTAYQLKEAIKKADTEVAEMDFGPLEDIEWSYVHTEDEVGKFLHEA